MNVIKEFPILYKKNSNDKIQLWKIFVIEESEVYTIRIERGQVNGKIVEEKSSCITEGKNLGRANETTARYQALLEAESKYTKKLDEGYTTDPNQAETDVIVLPMLAQKFQDMEHVVKYPCFTQVKLDGCRCISTVTEDVQLISRQGKPFFFMDHIREEIKEFVTILGTKLEDKFYLDGELYSHDLTFQEIVGLVKKSKTYDAEKNLQVKYFIYDCFALTNLSMMYEARYEFLQKVFKQSNFKHLFLVQTDVAKNREEVFVNHARYVADGWEGAIIRNKTLKYELDKRSKELLKLKSFLDEEFMIVGVEQATGMDEGTAIFVCKNNQDDRTFNCRPKGTREQRKEWYENRDKLIGKMLTVEFFERTDDCLPRFPVGKSLRDYEG
jgi:ATP-dependent DNA ligase